MRTISRMNDLEEFGIIPLTGEACGLGYRILCDVTVSGLEILSEALGIPDLKLASNWNTETRGQKHVGSFMMLPGMVEPLAVIALGRLGARKVVIVQTKEGRGVYADRYVSGVFTDDDEERLGEIKANDLFEVLREVTPRGTAPGGMRHEHVMSGRVV